MNFIKVCESFEQFKYSVLLIKLMTVFWETFVKVKFDQILKI